MSALRFSPQALRRKTPRQKLETESWVDVQSVPSSFQL
jgi:hypothetical protein